MERGNRGIAATKRRMLRDGEADYSCLFSPLL